MEKLCYIIDKNMNLSLLQSYKLKSWLYYYHARLFNLEYVLFFSAFVCFSNLSSEIICSLYDQIMALQLKSGQWKNRQKIKNWIDKGKDENWILSNSNSKQTKKIIWKENF